RYLEEHMDHRIALSAMPPGCMPLLDSLRSSLMPGWPPHLRPLQPGLLPPVTTTAAAAAAALPPGLNPLSIAAITGALQAPTLRPEQPSGSSSEAARGINNNVKDEEETPCEDDEEMDKDSETDPASPTGSPTPSSVSLCSPTRLTFPMSPGEGGSGGDGRRASLGNLSTKSLAALSKKRVTCDMCGKSYCDKGALKIHTSAVHLKEMQMCTVPGCTKEFTSRRSRRGNIIHENSRILRGFSRKGCVKTVKSQLKLSTCRNRHSKNKNMKLHTSDPAKLAAITAIQEQSRLLSGAMLPIRESRKRKSTEGALDLSMHSDTLTKPTPLLPVLPPPPSMHLMLLQQMQQMMHTQLFAQHQAAAIAAAAAAVTTAASAPSTTVSQTSPTAPSS
uniref:Bnc-1 n=1 Tax=Pristionchus pacificus TaxID=54126 RepID=A0A2A6C6D1_PRIPA